MSISIAKLEKELVTLKCKFKYKETSTPKQKWSDIVANCYNKCELQDRKVISTIYNIPTIITSRSSQVVNVKQSMPGPVALNNPSFFSSQTSRNENNHRDQVQEWKGRHEVVLIGDSHIRGLSSELKQNLDKT